MVSTPKKLNKDHKTPMVLPDATSLLERSPPESDTVTMTSRCAVPFPQDWVRILLPTFGRQYGSQIQNS